LHRFVLVLVSCIGGSCATTLSASLSVPLTGLSGGLSARAETGEPTSAGAEALVRCLPGDTESVADVGPGRAERPGHGDVVSGLAVGPGDTSSRRHAGAIASALFNPDGRMVRSSSSAARSTTVPTMPSAIAARGTTAWTGSSSATP